MLLCGVHSVLASVCVRCHNYTHHHPTDTTQEPDAKEPQFMEDTEITWEGSKRARHSWATHNFLLISWTRIQTTWKIFLVP